MGLFEAIGNYIRAKSEARKASPVVMAEPIDTNALRAERERKEELEYRERVGTVLDVIGHSRHESATSFYAEMDMVEQEKWRDWLKGEGEEKVKWEEMKLWQWF
jgi:hypothetical protein